MSSMLLSGVLLSVALAFVTAAPPSEKRQSCFGVMCMIYCPNGFALGSDGCPICQCQSDDDASARVNSFYKPTCHINVVFGCPDSCPAGSQVYVTDSNGCQKCVCADLP